MTQVTIKHASFSYRTEHPDPIRPGQKVLAEKMAGQGETVDIPFPDDVDRGRQFDAFLLPGERMPGGLPQPVSVPLEEEVPPSGLTDDELADWIKLDKPSVQAVIDAAEGDPVQARRLLQAEDVATGNDSRKGVVSGLTAIISGAD